MPIVNFLRISVKNSRSSIPSTYLEGFFSLSKLILPSTYCWIASDPNPFLHSARSITNPSSFIAPEQFQIEESDLLNVSLLASFPVLTIATLCFSASCTAAENRDFDSENVEDG